jgi:uncharacterized protein
MQPAISRAGRDRPLTVRPLSHVPSAATPRLWMAGDVFDTHLLNAMSLVFPPGERFFMRSVRALQKHVKSPALAAQVRDFLAQEAYHSREHHTFNAWLERFGLPTGIIERHIEARIQENSARRTDLENLALTCALEHFTAVMAKFLITHPEFRARFDRSMLPLWLWHAIEELDHKAVAFDVYQAAGGRYPQRITWMLAATVGLISSSLVVQWHLMKREGQHTDLRAYAKGLWRYLGPTGFARDVLPDYLRYFRRSFHPWETDDSALIAEAEATLAELLGTHITA